MKESNVGFDKLCNILEKKLKDKNIDYEEINDLDLMISLGFTQTPMLEVENEIMDFKGANNWINNK